MTAAGPGDAFGATHEIVAPKIAGASSQMGHWSQKAADVRAFLEECGKLRLWARELAADLDA